MFPNKSDSDLEGILSMYSMGDAVEYLLFDSEEVKGAHSLKAVFGGCNQPLATPNSQVILMNVCTCLLLVVGVIKLISDLMSMLGYCYSTSIRCISCVI